MTIWRVEVYRGEERLLLVQADTLKKVIRAIWRETIRGKRA